MTDFDLEIARRVCTAAEIEVVERVVWGASQRNIAAELEISREAVRDRLGRAVRKINGARRAGV